MRSVGIIANPAAGKDIRRLVAHASTFDNLEKVNIVRRVLLGLKAAGVDDVLFMPDAFAIARRALHNVHDLPPTTVLEMEPTFSEADSTCAAQAFQARGVGCIVTLGGDGTNRAVARGCGQVPLVPISTGTNNVFPQLIEGTIAGLVAGALASGVLDLPSVTRQTLCLQILRDGQVVDLALIDVAVSSERFVGSRAIWDPVAIRQIVSTCANPDATGLSAVGGYLPGVRLRPDEGLALVIGEHGQRVLAPIAPGLIAPINVAAHRRLRIGDAVDVDVAGGGILALDGERELPLRPSDRLQVRLSDRGPLVADVRAVLRQAVDRGVFSSSVGNEVGPAHGNA